eukprot:364355-Chlamydomonas_euryale.AAC.3
MDQLGTEMGGMLSPREGRRGSKQEQEQTGVQSRNRNRQGGRTLGVGAWHEGGRTSSITRPVWNGPPADVLRLALMMAVLAAEAVVGNVVVVGALHGAACAKAPSHASRCPCSTPLSCWLAWVALPSPARTFPREPPHPPSAPVSRARLEVGKVLQVLQLRQLRHLVFPQVELLQGLAVAEVAERADPVDRERQDFNERQLRQQRHVVKVLAPQVEVADVLQALQPGLAADHLRRERHHRGAPTAHGPPAPGRPRRKRRGSARRSLTDAPRGSESLARRRKGGKR